MKSFLEFLTEQNNLEQVVSELKSIGYTNIKNISKRRIAVLTDDNRIDILKDIESKLSGATHDETPKSDSSAGRVNYNGITILAKPASRQGKASAGISNEFTFVSGINSITENGPVNVILDGGNKKFKIMGCTGAEAVGTDTGGRKKADVILKDIKGNIYPVSIKKSNAETWESADSFFSQEASKIIKRAVDNGEAKLIEKGGVFQLQPNLAVKATRQEKLDVIFGSDIKGNGVIITANFSSRSFDLVDETLTVRCDHVATNLRDIVNTDKDVFFLIRNDRTRRSIRDYPGLRVLAAYKKRINRNVKILNRK